jgi:hypothetical protein
VPAGSGNIGVTGPDGSSTTIADGNSIVVTIPPMVLDGDSDYDLAYFERLIDGNRIELDAIRIDISQDGISWYTVFWWQGDDTAFNDRNTHLWRDIGYNGPEDDNHVFLVGDLYSANGYSSGIAIDADALAPVGTYYFVRFTAISTSTNDGADVDGVLVLP